MAYPPNNFYSTDSSGSFSDTAGGSNDAVILRDHNLEQILQDVGLIDPESLNFLPPAASTPIAGSSGTTQSQVAPTIAASSIQRVLFQGDERSPTSLYNGTTILPGNPRESRTNFRQPRSASTSSSRTISDSFQTPVTPNKTSKKRKPQTPSSKSQKKARTGNRTSRNSPPEINQSQGPSRDSGFGNEDDDDGADDDTNSLGSLDDGEAEDYERDTVQPFSIHRLPIERLQAKFKKSNGTSPFSELQIIEKVMVEVNKKYCNGTTRRAIFNQKSTPITTTSTDTSAESSAQAVQISFNVVAYVQKIEKRDQFLSRLGIEEKVDHINKIVFYYRPNEIFAITLGPTWKAIQHFSCYDFPCIISGRLASTEGNVEESIKRITGIVRTVRSTNKYSTLADQLKNVRVNVTKELRGNCSLYGLREFTSSTERPKSVRMIFGLAYVRILRRIDLENLPEILNHFSLICNGGTTYVYPSIDEQPRREEKQFDHFPPLRMVPFGQETKALEIELCNIIHGFMHNSNLEKIREFDFCDKYVDDWMNLEQLKIIYTTGGSTHDVIQTFTECPTALQVFTAIRENCPTLTNTKDIRIFKGRLYRNLKVEFWPRGYSELNKITRRLMDLLEGEMKVDGQDYWKTMGQWCTIREEYYYQLHKEFIELIRKPGLLQLPSSSASLPQQWTERMKTVQDYVESYRNKHGYFLPPTEDQIAGMSSQPTQFENQTMEDEEDPNVTRAIEEARRQLGARFIFDMMYTKKMEDGTCSSSIFYIFDRFDVGIRDASIKIKKSLDLLLNDGPTNATVSLLQKFYNHLSNSDNFFNAIFPCYDDFRNHMQGKNGSNNVSIVVAFLTQTKPQEPQRRALRINDYFQPIQRPTESREAANLPSLSKEIALELNFNTDNVRLQILNHLDNESLVTMCNELEIPDPNSGSEYDILLLASKLLNALIEQGYCVDNDSIDKPVTGKLLKMQNVQRFSLFRDQRINKEIYKLVRKKFISYFPGFIHKLECFQIHEILSAMPRLGLKFTEILADMDEHNTIPSTPPSTTPSG